MRRFGAFSLAAFYLLLSTGVYVCMLHCTVACLANKLSVPASKITADQDDDDEAAPEKGKTPDQHKKSCNGLDCCCCNQHGAYVVQADLSNLQLQINEQQVIVHFSLCYRVNFDLIGTTSPVTWPHTTGPPYTFKAPAYIINRSLLI